MTQIQKAAANGVIKTCLALWLQHGTSEASDVPARPGTLQKRLTRPRQNPKLPPEQVANRSHLPDEHTDQTTGDLLQQVP